MPDYALEGPVWSDLRITWSIATANRGSEPAAFGSFIQDARFMAEIADAFAAWDAASGLTFEQVADASNVDIRLGFASFDGQFGTLGEASYYFSFGSGGGTPTFIPGTVVRFDSSEVYTFSNGELRLANGVTLQTVATHEIGHDLGLDHYNGASAVMNSTSNPSINALTISDVHGIQALYGANTGTIAASTPNFNSDSRTDLLWQNKNGQVSGWTMDGFSVTGGALIGPNPGASWKVIDAGAFSGIGHTDLLWQNADGQLAIWTLSGLSSVGGATVGGNPGPSWHAIAAGDFSGDSRSEVLWQDDRGYVSVWTISPSLGVTGGAIIGQQNLALDARGTADVNGDGRDDILWQNANGQASFWTTNGTTVTGGGNIGSNPGASWHLMALGDLNADGRDDIVWQADNGQVSVWLLDGQNVIGSALLGNPGTSSHVRSTGDYNGDGYADILLQSNNGQVAIWTMNGTTSTGGAFVANPGADWLIA